jgi:Gluconolactonase
MCGRASRAARARRRRRVRADGTLIGRILLPERCANLCFGGRKRNRLFMTASQSVYALYVEAQGVAGG